MLSPSELRPPERSGMTREDVDFGGQRLLEAAITAEERAAWFHCCPLADDVWRNPKA